ncbi:MAG TPA: IclR family transcriptional regulator [Streptosporangiaceae bacterium]
MTESDRRIAGRYSVQSVARALRLVEMVADGPVGGVSLSELSRGLGISKSSTLSLARTLVGFGYLVDGHPGYTLGPALGRLGDAVYRQLPLCGLARPAIEDLLRATSLTSQVAVSDHGYLVFVDRVHSPGQVRWYTQLGERELPYLSAAGKAMLSAMGVANVRQLCAEHGMPARTDHTITDVDALLDDLAAARRRGFAVDDEEDADGVVCVGAAFFGRGDACAGALSVTGVKDELPASKIGELGGIVRRAADRVSAILGGHSYAELSLATAY